MREVGKNKKRKFKVILEDNNIKYYKFIFII